MLPTQLVPDDKEGKVLRVRLIQREGVKMFKPVYLFDEGSTISWIPCGRKLTCSYPARALPLRRPCALPRRAAPRLGRSTYARKRSLGCCA